MPNVGIGERRFGDNYPTRFWKDDIGGYDFFAKFVDTRIIFAQ